MLIRAMVKVNFDEADTAQVRALNTEMRKRGWTIYPSQPASYCVELRGVHSDEQAVSAVEQDVTQAAEAVHIYHWDAVCVVSGPHPQESTIKIAPRTDLTSFAHRVGREWHRRSGPNR